MDNGYALMLSHKRDDAEGLAKSKLLPWFNMNVSEPNWPIYHHIFLEPIALSEVDKQFQDLGHLVSTMAAR